MDKILILKDKYTPQSGSMLEETIRQRLATLRRIDNEQDYQLNENADRIEELERKNLELGKTITQEKFKRAALLKDLQTHNEILKELEYEKTKLISENRHKESEKNKIKSKCKIPSMTDENTLESGRKKFEYYKNLTGIRWDHPELKSCAKGYVTNKQDYIHPFSFELDDPNLETKLWEEIVRSNASKESE